MQVPFLHVQLKDIYHDLEWNNDDLEEEVIDEILDLDAVILRNSSLIVEDPQQ